MCTQWRDRNGESQLQLLILALLDKEQEMPGTSWRVRVKPPPSAAVPHLPAIAGAAAAAGGKKSATAKSACLQVCNLIEACSSCLSEREFPYSRDPTHVCVRYRLSCWSQMTRKQTALRAVRISRRTRRAASR